MRLVLDTNILVSAMFWKGNERRLLDKCLLGEHQLIISRPLLDELHRVLHEKFDAANPVSQEILRKIQQAADLVEPVHALDLIPKDPSDNRVLECALEGRADIIVTGDRHLLELEAVKGVSILRTSEALRRL
jgi:putative PIN family toxin of toxin-antitoxin system